MKKQLIALLMLVVALCRGQTPDWLWAKTNGGNARTYAEGTLICADTIGNIYVSGEVAGVVNFGVNALSANYGLPSILLAKYDAAGNVLWAKTNGDLTGNTFPGIKSMCTDISGNVYICGGYSYSIILDQDTLRSGVGDSQIFIAKYSPDGTLIWAKTSGCDQNVNAQGSGICTDSSGNVYLNGLFWDTITLDRDTLRSPGESSLFLAKFDAHGDIMWAHTYGHLGLLFGGGYGGCTYTNGNIYVLGSFVDTAFIGGYTLINAGYENIYLTKLDAEGNVVWATANGSSCQGNPEATGICSANGYVCVTGTFYDSIALGNYILRSDGGIEGFFLVLYDSLGDVVWAKTNGHVHEISDSVVYAWTGGISADANGNVYVAGGYRGILTLDTDTLPGSLTAYNIFLAKYDFGGNKIWTKTNDASDVSRAFANGIYVDAQENIYVVGGFDSSSTFGGTTLTATSTGINGYGAGNLLLAKLGYWKTEVNEVRNPSANIKISPNPTTGQFTIQLPKAQGNYHVVIYNTLGQKVDELALTQTQNTFNLSNQATGLYFVRVQTEAGVVEGKVMVVR